METLKTIPVVELGDDGCIIIDREKIEEYLTSHPEIEHASVRGFFECLAELSEAEPVEKVGS